MKSTFCKNGEYVMKNENFKVLTLIKEVEELNNNTPEGCIVDGDTILTDLIESSDFELSGMCQDIFNIWKNSTDKNAVEQMFFEFTSVEFIEFLKKCKEEISR